MGWAFDTAVVLDGDEWIDYFVDEVLAQVLDYEGLVDDEAGMKYALKGAFRRVLEREKADGVMMRDRGMGWKYIEEADEFLKFLVDRYKIKKFVELWDVRGKSLREYGYLESFGSRIMKKYAGR